MMQSFRMAMKSIAGNKLRAALTMLGIIIGVTALVILVSLVSGATSSVTSRISSLGSNLLTVTISDDKNRPLSLEELKGWMEEETIAELSPIAQESMTGKYSSTSETLTVYGTTPAYYDIQSLNLLLGRFLKTGDVDSHTSVCVLNEAAAQELVGYTDCLNEHISLNGMKLRVVGILEDDEESLTSVFGSDTSVAYVPYSTLVRMSTTVSSDLEEFYVSAAEGHTVDEAEATMTKLLLKRFSQDEDAFSVRSQDALEGTMSSVNSTLTLLLGGIAGISLIVGGIGIMNIMLVSVTERTREIGIRKAIGATRRAILAQFLIEAVVLCMMGCLIGIALSWFLLQCVSIVVSSLNMSFHMNGAVVALAVVFCLAIGILFGLYPANKAAKMKPIDALHYGG